MLNIAVVILFYNKLDQTIACVESFIPSGVKVYVLNNGSDNTSLSILQDKFSENSQVCVFSSLDNIGVSRGRNYLIKNTTEDWLFSIDNDIVVVNSKNWLKNLTLHIGANPSIDVFIPRLFNIHDQTFSTYKILHLDGREISEIDPASDIVNTFPGGASILNRRIFEKIGLYDENMFVGFEDLELAIRTLFDSNKMICKTIHDIHLAHHHQIAENKSDIISIKTRYNDVSIKNSFNYLQQKHNIIFKHEWEWWVRRQTDIMIQQNKEKKALYLARTLYNLISKLFLKNIQ